MEEQLRQYYKKVKHITDPYERAAALKDILVHDIDVICGSASDNSNFDIALNTFYLRKAYNYTMQLLDSFIAQDSFPCDSRPNAHFSEKYDSIKVVFCELFAAEVKSSNSSPKECV